jgi:hypothetical protein
MTAIIIITTTTTIVTTGRAVARQSVHSLADFVAGRSLT